MESRRKILGLLGILVVPYLCAAFAFVYYMQTHSEPLPHWVTVTMLVLLVATCIAGGVYLPRLSRKAAANAPPEQKLVRQAGAEKGLKTGIILFSLIFLNGLRMVLQNEIRWQYAVGGLTLDALFVIVCWTSLRRLKKQENDNPTVEPREL